MQKEFNGEKFTEDLSKLLNDHELQGVIIVTDGVSNGWLASGIDTRSNNILNIISEELRSNIKDTASKTVSSDLTRTVNSLVNGVLLGLCDIGVFTQDEIDEKIKKYLELKKG